MQPAAGAAVGPLGAHRGHADERLACHVARRAAAAAAAGLLDVVVGPRGGLVLPVPPEGHEGALHEGRPPEPVEEEADDAESDESNYAAQVSKHTWYGPEGRRCSIPTTPAMRPALELEWEEVLPVLEARVAEPVVVADGDEYADNAVLEAVSE